VLLVKVTVFYLSFVQSPLGPHTACDVNARSLEVTLLTGLRTGEVIGARWTEIDLKRKIWVIPPERLKDRNTRTEPHRVPLSPQVVAILKTLRD
jgi:integrase